MNEQQVALFRQRYGPVPIHAAVVAWNEGHPHGDGRVMVLRHDEKQGDPCGPWCTKLKLTCSIGADCAAWRKASAKQLVHRLMAEAWHLVITDNLDAREVHAALMVVPEFAAIFGSDAPWPYAG